MTTKPASGSFPKIAIVGPCGAGKTTLAQALKAQQYNAHAVAQEHSYVSDMWQKFTKPDLLIYLDATLPTIAQRRQIHWGQNRLDELNHRLAHARQHCHFYLLTDNQNPETILNLVVNFIQNHPVTQV